MRSPAKPKRRSDNPYRRYERDPVGFIREVLEIEPTVEQIAICESVLTEQTTCVQAAHGVGKCVAQNELIPLADGREVKAKDLIGKNFELITLDDRGVVIPVKAIAAWNRKEPVYEYETEDGRKIIRNVWHPLWASVNGETGKWQTAYSLYTLQMIGCEVRCAVPIAIPVGDKTQAIADALGRQFIGEDLTAPPGCRWEKVVSIRELPEDWTVALEVPGYNTYLTTFYEHNTAIAAGIALWYIYAVEGVVISTAPTARQVNALLWKEIRRGKVRGELPGEVFKTPKLEFIPNIAYGFGFTAKDNNSNAFQGSHDVKQMIIVDEACGISPEIWEGAVSCLTGSLNRLLAIGNPIKTNTPFHEECSRRSLHVPVWNHPNVRWAYEKHPDGIHRLKPEIYRLIMDEKGRVKEDWPDSPSLKEDAIPGAISVRWIEQMARPRGEKSSFWLTRVEGRFAYDSENSLISRQWFREARYRYDSDPDYWNHVASVHPYRAGLDVGDGSDPHAIVAWRGPLLQFAREIPTTGDRLDIVRAAGAGINHLRQYGGTLAVDRTGVGSGAHSIIQEAINHAIDQSIADDLATFVEGEIQLSGCVAEGIAWGSKPIAGVGTTPIDQLINLKIQQAWLLREAFQYGEVAIAPLGEVEQLLEDELCGIYWDDTSKGQLRIEDKAKTRKRLRRSPNLADATIMGFAANASILTADMFSVIKKD